MFTQFRCSKMRFLPENGKLKRARVKKAEEGGSVERLKASLEKGKLLCGLGSSALCVACFGLRYLHRIRKSHVYAIFVPKRSADALVHSPMRQMYANIVAVSLRIHKRAAPQRAASALRARCKRAAGALRARCERAARTRCGRAAGALRTRCGRARCVRATSALRARCADALWTRCGRAADALRTRSCIHQCHSN